MGSSTSSAAISVLEKPKSSVVLLKADMSTVELIVDP